LGVRKEGFSREGTGVWVVVVVVVVVWGVQGLCEGEPGGRRRRRGRRHLGWGRGQSEEHGDEYSICVSSEGTRLSPGSLEDQQRHE
jgi:chloramphenicol 3-O-phosphotransferase